MEGCVKVCQCLSHCLHRGGLRAGRYTPIEIVADERRRVYSSTRRVKPKSAKALRVRHEEKQVTLRKWKERLSESSKGGWTRLLLHNLDAWLESHGQMNFYLTQVMSGHGALNAYLFRMKLADSLSAPTAIQEGEMITPGTPSSSVRHFDCTGRRR